MWKLICTYYFSHLLTIVVTWSKTKQPTHTTHNDRREVSKKEVFTPVNLQHRTVLSIT